jgi:hypothetical protein
MVRRRRGEPVLDHFDLTVVADLNQPDEYVLVPPDHPAMQELTAAGARPCGVEVSQPGQLPEIRFGSATAAGVRRYLFWWADWSSVAAKQRSSAEQGAVADRPRD